MKLLISLVIIGSLHLSSVNCGLELIDLPDIFSDFRKTREKSSISTKLPSYNSITDNVKSTTPSTTAGFRPLQITHEDVVSGSNSVYGNHAQLGNGGIIFAISQGQGSTSQPMMSAAPPQPVLMQYLSANGIPSQTAVQYIQLLRPIMMVPATPYQSPKPVYERPTETTPPPLPKPLALNSYAPYSRPSVVGSYSSNYPSYHQSNPRPVSSQQSSYDFGLNLNEYMPSASNRVNTVLARSSMTSSLSPYAYNPTNYQQMAQRA